MAGYRMATFSSDATVPIGHPLCGGWIKPATEIVDRQHAHGVVIFGDESEPIVLCAVDWCELRCDAFDWWRDALAKAVGTMPSRVFVNTIHAHNAPLADPDADRIMAKEGIDYRTVDAGFLKDAIARNAAALKASLSEARTITHVGLGKAKVEKVASSRRLIGPNGKVIPGRMSTCTDAKLQGMPDGVIDPYLATVSFWDGEACVAALHHYATHPMSYYGDGGITPDFAGLAREVMRAERPGVHHIYFTGCAGNVAAGKYNDGSKANRSVLRDRIVAGMKGALAATRPEPIRRIDWRAVPVHLPPRKGWDRDYFSRMLRGQGHRATVSKGAMGLAWLDRHERGDKIDFCCCRVNDGFVLYFPGESFVEYQLAAQQRRKGRFVAVAAYGQCSPSYIPTAAAYGQGGYETSFAFVGPEAEPVFGRAIQDLLA